MKLAVKIITSEKGGYVAVCTSLPGFTCWGKSHDDALKKLDEAIRGYFAAVNNFVPENLDWEVVEV